MNLQESIRRILREEEDKYDDKVGKTFWFEYHCYESPESCDAEIWYRSHQKVKVIGVSEWSYDDKEWRQEDGNPRVYLVQWEDGFQYDVFEDELMESPNEFYRPSPPKRKIQENIRRILREEDYSPAGKEIIPNEIVVHKSNPLWRKNILETGLQTSVGDCYSTYAGYGEKCIPAIFATNSTNKRSWFDSTYDDDIWFIDTTIIPDVKWYKDRHFESTKKHIVTFQNIPSEALTLKYEGSGRNDFLEESIRRISEELSNEKPSFLSAIKKFGLYYFMETTQIPFTDIILKIGEPTRDIIERYIIDFIMDEGETHHYGNDYVSELYVDINLYLTGLKVIDKIISDGNLLEIEVTEYERGHYGYNEEIANYINESKEFDDGVIYEIFNTIRKKKDFQRR
jgi:hypothetical protein